MQGQSPSDVNTCARCSLAYPPLAHVSPCHIHSSELSAALVSADGQELPRRYPCCGALAGSKGCAIAPHLPLYQTIDGRVQHSRKIGYGNVDLHAGRWVSTRMPLQDLSSKEAAAEPESAEEEAEASPSAAAQCEEPLSAPVLPVDSLPRSIPDNPASLGAPVPRSGDEIIVCGQLYHTGTPIVLWGDVGGYDHYRVERRFSPYDTSDWANTQRELPKDFTTPNRYDLRKDGLSAKQVEAVRGGQWDLPTLRQQVRSVVLHYDVAGVSSECFTTLQDRRDLSIHFMLDIDGTIYQAMDLKEKARHATIANTTSIGIEIANMGAYDPGNVNPGFKEWYGTDKDGNTIITIPARFGNGRVRTPNFVGRPARPNPVPGVVQGSRLVQMDYTPQQYAALAKLLATLTTVFPDVKLDYPRDARGQLITSKLPDEQLSTYKGILGHYHIQTNKIDPGPAMQWDTLMAQADSLVQRSKQAKEAMQSVAAKVVPNAAAPSADAARRDEVLRKLERRAFAAAEAAASVAMQPSDPFYLVESAWYSQWKGWLSGADASVQRPGPVSNLALLQADERMPREGLLFNQHYRAVHARVWEEIVDLYGADQTIVRPSTSIYALPQKTVA